MGSTDTGLAFERCLDLRHGCWHYEPSLMTIYSLQWGQKISEAAPLGGEGWFQVWDSAVRCQWQTLSPTGIMNTLILRVNIHSCLSATFFSPQKLFKSKMPLCLCLFSYLFHVCYTCLIYRISNCWQNIFRNL